MYRRRSNYYRSKSRSYTPRITTGTRYRSSRPVTGLYRAPSRLMLTGRARRLFGKQRLRRALYSMAEHKFWDTEDAWLGNTATAITDAGKVRQLTSVIQGLTDNQRIGDKCTGVSLQGKIMVEPNNIAAQQDFFSLRCTVFIWKDDDEPTMDDIYEDWTGTTTIPKILCHLSHDRKVKRKILLDKYYYFGSSYDAENSLANAMSNPNSIRTFYIPLKTLKRRLNVINFEGATVTAVNHIYMILSSDTLAATPESSWQVYTNWRYNFIDM